MERREAPKKKKKMEENDHIKNVRTRHNDG